MTNEDLVKAIQAGSAPDALEQLYINNEGYIKKLANKYIDYAEFEDLVQEGFLGLYEAAKRYESDKEVAFMTYAGYWIKLAMYRYALRNSGLVRIPEDMLRKVWRYRKFMAAFHAAYGQEPPRTLTRYRLGLGEESLKNVEKAARIGRIQSLDEPLKEDEELCLGDLVAGDGDMADNVLEGVAVEELKRDLWAAVDALEGKQPEILRWHYEDGLTLKAIGDKLSLSPERIRQLEVRAMRVLRKPKYACRLRPYLTDQEKAAAYHGNGVRRFQTTWTSSTERVALRRAEIPARGF